MAALSCVRPGATLGDIAHAIRSIAQCEGFIVVRQFCGHGIGQVHHENLQVLHYGCPGQELRLGPGMVFTIEPMLNGKRRPSTPLMPTACAASMRPYADLWTHL
jgi:methionyl aminopeptidase